MCPTGRLGFAGATTRVVYARGVPWVVPALVQWGINVLALIVADWVFSGVSIGRWGSLLFAGAVLGLANVFLKPLLTFIALPLILLTLGIA